MKNFVFVVFHILFSVGILAQSPEKFSYQAVIRDAEGKLLQNKPVGIRISVLEGSSYGPVVYTETHHVVTNINGLISLEIGDGTTTGSFADINWSNSAYFLKTETDPTGGTNYTMTTISQFLSVPYALYATTAGMGWPVLNQTVIVSSQTWTVPAAVSKIKVELWGASGGGGGAGAFSNPYSFSMNFGGYGGSGGFASQELSVEPNQEFAVVIGEPGAPGINAVEGSPGTWYGDTDGEAGGDSWFGNFKAAGGSGGKRGSFDFYTVHGSPGTDNTGEVTGYGDEAKFNILNVFQGQERSYINDRVLTSRPGKGGEIISAYSIYTSPTGGEGGCAIITFFD